MKVTLDTAQNSSHAYTLEMTLGSVFDEARLRSVAVFGVRLTGTDGAVLADYPDVSLDGSRLEAFLRDVRAANVPDYQVADLLQDFVGA